MRFSAKKLKIFLKNLKTHLVGGKNPLSECVLRVYLHLFVIGCRVVDKLTVLGETRAMAGAIPRVFGFIVFEGAAEVWASGCGGGKNTYRRFKSVDGKLWAQDGARGIEKVGVGV